MTCLSKWFYDTSTGAATGAARCDSFIGENLVSWPLAIDERGGYEDLCGSGRWSVIPYVYGGTRIVLLKPTLPKPAFFAPVKRRLPEPFIAQGQAVTLRPGAR
jgi:hypothetical protein